MGQYAALFYPRKDRLKPSPEIPSSFLSECKGVVLTLLTHEQQINFLFYKVYSFFHRQCTAW